MEEQETRGTIILIPNSMRRIVIMTVITTKKVPVTFDRVRQFNAGNIVRLYKNVERHK